jgi:phenylalanine ammonia-lyase
MITISGDGLTLAEIAAVVAGTKAELSRDPAVLDRIEASAQYIARAVAEGQQIYGVTTLFGGMADHVVPKEQTAELQRSVIWNLTASTGPRIPIADVRAAMLLRANSLMRGVSGLRLEIIRRLEAFLNAGAAPHVFELGSIGASGDLVPLSYIAGSILGLDRKYRVDFSGDEIDCISALERLGLAPIRPLAKEALALVNGTSVSTGIAANCVNRAQGLLALALAAHALYVQALQGTNQSFHPFVHSHKPHPGQVWSAREMWSLVEGSTLIHDESAGDRSHRKGRLIQDRYSLRCLPQYFGPIVDALAQIVRQIEVEANSANDNPLIDADTGMVFHTGNFLGQYIGVAMDQLRYHIGLAAKHLDAQIALLVEPAFSLGLAPSLVGNEANLINVGFKSLQLVNNSIMPLLTYYGNSLADRFPTHAEQFNQNINSQSMGSANLARKSLDLFEHYLANALLFGVQGVELRSFAAQKSYDARRTISPATVRLYETVYAVLGRKPSAERPLVWDDTDDFFERRTAAVLKDIAGEGRILASIAPLAESLRAHCGVRRP